MQNGFTVGERVEVTGEVATLFTGQSGTVLDVVLTRADNSDYNIYWIEFGDKQVRMIGRYLRPAFRPEMLVIDCVAEPILRRRSI
jgi:hypothetical protein